MASFIKNMVGNEGMAELVGQEAGKAVTGLVKNFMGSDEDKKEEEGGGGLNLGDLVGGKKDESKGGIDAGEVVGNLVSAVSGGDSKEGSGVPDVSKLVGGLF